MIGTLTACEMVPDSVIEVEFSSDVEGVVSVPVFSKEALNNSRY